MKHYILEMDTDISKILADWPFDPDKNIRITKGNDGRSLLQVRQPMGIEQYELSGRPDGYRPNGFSTVLAMVESKLKDHIAESFSAQGFELSSDDLRSLQNEGILFYYRYLLLFQIDEYERVVADTDHNLRLCDLLEQYYPVPEERNSMLQFKPYIIRMNAVSRAMIQFQEGKIVSAKELLENAIDTINNLEPINSPVFRLEKARGIAYLKGTLEKINDKKDDPKKHLEKELEAAVSEENYERAAELRDQLKRFGQNR